MARGEQWRQQCPTCRRWIAVGFLSESRGRVQYRPHKDPATGERCPMSRATVARADDMRLGKVTDA